MVLSGQAGLCYLLGIWSCPFGFFLLIGEVFFSFHLLIEYVKSIDVTSKYLLYITEPRFENFGIEFELQFELQ